MEENNIRKQIEKDFKHVDLTKYEYCYNANRIYFTNNLNPPMMSTEVWWSIVLRFLKLKKCRTYGKPKEVIYI